MRKKSIFPTLGRKSLLVMGLLMPVVVSAQVFSNVELSKMDVADCGDVRMAGMSADGKYAFVTSMYNTGLKRISLDGKHEIVSISNAVGAGIEPVISANGNQVLHSADQFDEEHLRQTSLRFVDLSKGTDGEVMPAQRKVKATAKHAELAAGRPIVQSLDLRIQLTVDGVTTTLAPNGDGEDVNYIWASLSPSGTRILYYVSDEGAYVCNLQGEDVQFVAYDLQAPQWYDDNTVVGMKTADDGHFFTSSAIVAYTLDGDRQVLTDGSLRLMYPFCSSVVGKIMCSSANGELYMLNLKK